MKVRALPLRIVAAREAVECGDRDLALVILVELEREVAPVRMRARCACGFTAEWPGLLDRHRVTGACPLERAA